MHDTNRTGFIPAHLLCADPVGCGVRLHQRPAVLHEAQHLDDP